MSWKDIATNITTTLETSSYRRIPYNYDLDDASISIIDKSFVLQPSPGYTEATNGTIVHLTANLTFYYIVKSVADYDNKCDDFMSAINDILNLGYTLNSQPNFSKYDGDNRIVIGSVSFNVGSQIN